MSTNSNCLFIEYSPGQWYYILENYNAPKNAWDWREYATAYGPFPSEEEADEHLSRHHANPGGSNTAEYDPAFSGDPVLQQLIRDAVKPRSRFFLKE